MYSLQERKRFCDELWRHYNTERNPDRVMEYIKALELNYRHIELLRERARLLSVIHVQQQKHRIQIEQERRRREQLFGRKFMDKQCKAIQWILLGVIFGILAVVAFGCQTLGGACRDIESAARYGHQHMLVDK